MDFPSSKYSLTDGLKKPVGITGDEISDWSLSSRWSGSGTAADAPGVRGFFARFDRTLCCSSDPSVIKSKCIWVEAARCDNEVDANRNEKNVSKINMKPRRARECINFYLTSAIEPHWKINDHCKWPREFAKCFTKSMRRKNCVACAGVKWIVNKSDQRMMLHYHNFPDVADCVKT